MQETCVAEKLMAEFNGARVLRIRGGDVVIPEIHRDSDFPAACGLFRMANELLQLQGSHGNPAITLCCCLFSRRFGYLF